jgi:hypothetical protein
MKKILSLLCAVVLISSCDINTDPVEFTATTELNEAIAVSIAQTSGTSVAFDENVDQDLNEIVANFSAINNVNINALSYRFANATGNANATIESATIVIEGITIASLSNVNIHQEANSGTTFNISDAAILDQLEAAFLANTEVNIQFSGTAVSEEGPVGFEVVVSVNLTVSL